MFATPPKPPKILGRVVYFFGYPLFRLLIQGTTRAYAIVRVDNELLVTQNWLGFQKKWRLPGGGVAHTESIADAIVRELHEEVGLRVSPEQLQLVQNEPFRSGIHYNYFLYVLDLSEKPKLRIDQREILQAKFVAIDALQNMPISEEIRNFLKLEK
jgi:ADP-ribose pyrophosphatase YjhB (NUDIX family)